MWCRAVPYFMNYSYMKDLGHDSGYSKQPLVEMSYCAWKFRPAADKGEGTLTKNLNLPGFNCIGRANPEKTTAKDRQWPVSQ